MPIDPRESSMKERHKQAAQHLREQLQSCGDSECQDAFPCHACMEAARVLGILGESLDAEQGTD